MKKEYRLLKKQDFKAVLDFHKRVSRENFTIFHKKNDLKHCRVGVSVSSKIGNSVIRHKVKRQVISIVDNILNRNTPYDFVIIVKGKFLENSYNENFKVFQDYIVNFMKKEKVND